MAIYALDGIAPEFPADGDYWVAPTATIIGRVRLKKGASIWWGAVLRGDNEWIEVGENSNVQDNATLHTDPGLKLAIGAGVTIGHGVIVHGATVGDGALIGMGSTLLNRSKIGAQSIVGANALVAEGKEFAERSLIVGVPGKAIRTLTDEELKFLPVSAAIYTANAKRYREGLKEIG